jgi:multidrug efflux pump subunit AcrA (membrane-fusion protein)
MIRTLILPLLGVIGFGTLLWHLARTHEEPSEQFPPVAPVRREFAGTVAGAGVVEPRSESIQLCAEVPGIVAEVAVREGQSISAGEVVLRLEDRWKRAELEVRQAALSAAGEDLAKLRGLPRPEDLPPSAARVRGAQAAAETQRDQLARAEDLHRQKVITEQEVIERRKAFDTAQATLEEAQAEDARLRAGAWERDVAIAAAAVEQARASVDLARVEVERFVVRAPVAGTVLRVDVRPGEFVGTPPGKSLVVLGDTSRLHVRVSIDEHDLPRFIPGAPALGYLRGDAEHPVRLAFVRAVPTVAPKQNLSGDSAERVDTRVLQVLFEIVDDAAAAATGDGTPTRELFVGQQLDVQIDATAR